ncbi:MAG: hypothetical protein JXR81_01305 [Candidatus Goldbacteria bacterium]|nr:hypothetical protein [Candidatus Goldiibacteriota bacterium]
MKKGVLCFLLFVFVIVLVIGCNKNSAPFSPLAVNVLKPTPTNTATPDVKFSVFLMQEATPVASVQVKMAPQGVTTQAACFTDETGKAEFAVHSGGNWDVIIPSNDGFENMYYMVEPLSNTVLAIDRGAQTLEMALVSGSLALPIQANEQVFMITYHTAVSKLYNLEILGVPQGLSVSATSTQVNNDGDKVFFTIYYPKSFEGFGGGINISVKGTATVGSSVILANSLSVVKDWSFVVTADVKFAKTFWGVITYWMGAKNYTYDAQGFQTTGPINAVTDSYNFYGDLAAITNAGADGGGDILLGEGYYSNLAVAKANGGYEWVMDHNGVDATITIRFTDSGNLDVKRTFKVDGELGGWCGRFFQNCFGFYSEFDKCNDWPNTTGCSYSVLRLKRSKSANVRVW